MSKINVNTWEPESGTAATLMASGDTVTLPDGAILAVASGGDINVASGGEIDIASGATLDVNGTIDLTGATTTGFPAGGLTAASQWRLTSDFSGSTATPISTNLEEVDAPVGFGVLGSSMTQSSGVFTFPSTGYWLIRFDPYWYTDVAITACIAKILTTVDDSTWLESARAGEGAYTSIANYQSASLGYIFDVTSTSTHKVRFDVDPNGTALLGDSSYNETHMTFLRLADT